MLKIMKSCSYFLIICRRIYGPNKTVLHFGVYLFCCLKALEKVLMFNALFWLYHFHFKLCLTNHMQSYSNIITVIFVDTIMLITRLKPCFVRSNKIFIKAAALQIRNTLFQFKHIKTVYFLLKSAHFCTYERQNLNYFIHRRCLNKDCRYLMFTAYSHLYTNL